MAARDAIIERNAALREIARTARAGATGVQARGDTFAAQMAAATSTIPTVRGSERSVPSVDARDGIGTTLSAMLARVNTVQQQEDVASEAYERGETTDIAGVMLAGQRASLAFEATMQVRNKLLSAYKDVMSMQI
jgi:flagellar hook-basal body complex protein FliE